MVDYFTDAHKGTASLKMAWGRSKIENLKSLFFAASAAVFRLGVRHGGGDNVYIYIYVYMC